MVQKLAASAALALLVVSIGASGAMAKGSKKKDSSSQGEVPDAVSRQLQWEEKVVGPKEKGVDHKKIAAMQEQARREDAERANQPPPRKSRAEGVSAPATSTLPTMDIEKPAAGHRPVRKTSQAEQEPPRRKDALDSLLADEAGPTKTASSAGGGRAGLANVFASDDRGSSSRAPAPSHSKKAHKKHRRN